MLTSSPCKNKLKTWKTVVKHRKKTGKDKMKGGVKRNQKATTVPI